MGSTMLIVFMTRTPMSTRSRLRRSTATNVREKVLLATAVELFGPDRSRVSNVL
jgi:hypothetical protein